MRLPFEISVVTDVDVEMNVGNPALSRYRKNKRVTIKWLGRWRWYGPSWMNAANREPTTNPGRNWLEENEETDGPRN